MKFLGNRELLGSALKCAWRNLPPDAGVNRARDRYGVALAGRRPVVAPGERTPGVTGLGSMPMRRAGVRCGI